MRKIGKKLKRFIKFLNGTKDDVLTLEADDTHIVKWHVDAAFAVHDDFRSHTGATLTLGSGAILSASTKQKVKTRSSTEAELIGIDDYIEQVVWTKNFLEAQGYGVNDTVIYQDNMSTIKLAHNGRANIGKRSRHLNIKQVNVKYCPSDEILADYMSKPLTGRKFQRDRRLLLNLPNTDTLCSQECVGQMDEQPMRATVSQPVIPRSRVAAQRLTNEIYCHRTSIRVGAVLSLLHAILFTTYT
jgi:hypothetical protein